MRKVFSRVLDKNWTGLKFLKDNYYKTINEQVKSESYSCIGDLCMLLNNFLQKYGLLSVCCPVLQSTGCYPPVIFPKTLISNSCIQCIADNVIRPKYISRDTLQGDNMFSTNENLHENMKLNANDSKNNGPKLNWANNQVPPHVKLLGKKVWHY